MLLTCVVCMFVCLLFFYPAVLGFVCYISLVAPELCGSTAAKQKLREWDTGLDDIYHLIAFQACGKTVTKHIFSKASFFFFCIIINSVDFSNLAYHQNVYSNILAMYYRRRAWAMPHRHQEVPRVGPIFRATSLRLNLVFFNDVD